MKLAACYTIFNGLELLNDSIAQIIDCVDEIIICWQKNSNKGNESTEIEAFISQYAGKKHIHLVRFYPNLTVNTKENERLKHNIMLESAKKLGCTHFFLSATDHFYKKKEFLEAKKMCFSLDYDVTFTKMYTYYKKITWQLTPIEAYLMPFICKLYSETTIDRKISFPYDKIVVDPSVRIYPSNNWYIFSEEEIMMHHYSMIRHDIKNKFKNAAASIRWNEKMIEDFQNEWDNYDIDYNPGIKYFQGRKIKIVENYFFPNIKST
jgi:hypothetical protein